jgi:D-sedoheptulose 7-phosphate isomerase
LSGQGYHIQGDHRVTIPNLHNRIAAEIPRGEVENKLMDTFAPTFDLYYQLERVAARCPSAAEAVKNLILRKPELDLALTAVCQTYLIIAQSFDRGGRLFIYGNGGSMADAQHIVGELQKSFAKKRPLTEVIKERLNQYEPEKLLSTHLEAGLPAFVLGMNPALNSAIDNDFNVRWLNVAQEFQVLAKTGDVFFGISTSGKAQNIKFAGFTARALGCPVILLTGEGESEFAAFADVTIHAPGTKTDLIQESHISLYHCLCDMLERDFF